jgi:hypothetical protein
MDIDEAARKLNIERDVLTSAITSLHDTVVQRGKETDKKLDKAREEISEIRTDIAVIKRISEFTEVRVRDLEKNKGPSEKEIKAFIDSGVQKQIIECSSKFQHQKKARDTNSNLAQPRRETPTWSQVIKVSIPIFGALATVFLTIYGLQ